MSQTSYDIVIIGAGHGGASAAIALRQRGFSGSILMIGRDLNMPYERPPLSKEYLAGEKSFERILIRPATFWADRNIELMLGCEVTFIDPATKRLQISGHSEVRFGKLIWAAGGDPRQLSCKGGTLAGVHSVRDRSDIDQMKTQLTAGPCRAVIIGGGYIGLETAAVLNKLGCNVTIIEAQNRVLARVAGDDLSNFYETEHTAHGVGLRTGMVVEELRGASGHVTDVVLADGTILPAQMVVVGIGILPAIEPLLAAGAKGENGIDVDEYCRTSLPDTYAIGDCAAHYNAYAAGSKIRIESVQNANDMAVVAARDIVGDPIPYDALPWFWSNQYDLRLQTVGLSSGYDQTILRGKPIERKFSVIYLREGRVIALDCVNCTKDFVQGRKLVEARIRPDTSALADTAIPLKTLI